MNTDDDPLHRLREQIIGAAFEVANTLGHGFLESVYRRALTEELSIRGIPARYEVPFDITYKGIPVGSYFADIVVADLIVLELKAAEAIVPAHVGQVLNYLRASGLSSGLILNFGSPRLEIRRVLAP